MFLYPSLLSFSFQMPSRFGTAVRIFITTLFAAVVLFAILLAYVTGYQFIHTEQHHLSFGLYGAFLSLHLLLQSLFAYLEHRQMRGPSRPQHLRHTVALCIAAYQEDPDYLRKCLQSIRRISFPGLKVVLVVDGNRQEDGYMMDIFQEVMGGSGADRLCGVEGELPLRRGWGRRERPVACRGGCTGGQGGSKLPLFLHHARVGWQKGSHVYSLQSTGRYCGLHTGRSRPHENLKYNKT